MILKTIRDVLSEDGTDVYYPSQHKGECRKKYIVIKNEGILNTVDVSSERPVYTLMLYVPENNYSDLETFLYETKVKMKKLFPMLMYAGNETPAFYDDKAKAHMISTQYLGVRKIENW